TMSTGRRRTRRPPEPTAPSAQRTGAILGEARRPGARQEARGDQQSGGTGEEGVGDLGLRRLASQLRAELRVGRVQGLARLRLEELTARRPRDRAQRLRIRRHASGTSEAAAEPASATPAAASPEAEP